MNQVEIIGTITNDFTKEKKIKIGKEELYSSFVLVKRDSGVYDEIPVVVNYNTSIKNGDRVIIIGSFVSYNDHSNDKNKLLLFVFVDNINLTTIQKDKNYVHLDGFICKKQNKRKTPLGRIITDMILAVNTTEKHSDYIPCIFWGRNANYVNEQNIGDKLDVVGRCQSRKYRKMICERFEELVAYEISVSEIQ